MRDGALFLVVCGATSFIFRPQQLRKPDEAWEHKRLLFAHGSMQYRGVGK